MLTKTFFFFFFVQKYDDIALAQIIKFSTVYANMSSSIIKENK